MFMSTYLFIYYIHIRDYVSHNVHICSLEMHLCLHFCITSNTTSFICSVYQRHWHVGARFFSVLNREVNYQNTFVCFSWVCFIIVKPQGQCWSNLISQEVVTISQNGYKKQYRSPYPNVTGCLTKRSYNSKSF